MFLGAEIIEKDKNAREVVFTEGTDYQTNIASQNSLGLGLVEEEEDKDHNQKNKKKNNENGKLRRSFFFLKKSNMKIEFILFRKRFLFCLSSNQ